jgi:hypothetical protein
MDRIISKEKGIVTFIRGGELYSQWVGQSSGSVPADRRLSKEATIKAYRRDR